MLDIKFIRENADVVRDAAAKKNLDPKVIDELLAVDEKRRAMNSSNTTCFSRRKTDSLGWRPWRVGLSPTISEPG